MSEFEPTVDEIHERICKTHNVGDNTNNADYVLFDIEPETRRQLLKESLLQELQNYRGGRSTDFKLIEVMETIIEELM